MSQASSVFLGRVQAPDDSLADFPQKMMVQENKHISPNFLNHIT
jgi:hypothetical protein